MPDSSLPLPWIESPLVECPPISKIAGCRIYLKLDNLQPSGSFKSRGIGNFLLSHIRALPPDAPKPHFYTSSGGNAGLACVIAAQTLGYPSTVVVPLSTKPRMVDLIRKAGASDVIQKGATWFDADTYLRQEILPKDSGGVYVPPFDHEEVWNGNATVSQEIRSQLGEDPAIIVCSVGGGGLFSGIMRGLGKASTKVIAVETIGAESLHLALKAGERISLPGITSLATSLGAVRVCEQCFEDGQDHRVTSVTVTDEEAVKACLRFADEERMLVEPACGATLALAYEDRLESIIPDLNEESKVVLEVCGGRNITVGMLAEYAETYS